MKVLRIKISALTASFRYPGFIVGTQPTLPVPPLSTIYGLISAAKGQITTPLDLSVGFICSSKGEGVDVETIYELTKARKAKSNIVRREFLYNLELLLYINDPKYEIFFQKPFYPLLLGRSDNLAKVNKIEKIELIKRKGVRLGKTILPFGIKGAHGIFQALPTHFTDTIPREARGVRPFILMDKFFEFEGNCYFDPDNEWGIWMHNNEKVTSQK